MLLNRSKFDVLCFHLYRYRDALHWKRTGVLCAGVCSITVEQDCAACILEALKTVANSNADLNMSQKIQRRRLSVQVKRIWTTKKRQKRQLSMFVKNLAKKSLRRRSQETQIPPATIFHILRKRLIMEPYKLQLVQAIMAEDKQKRKPN